MTARRVARDARVTVEGALLAPFTEEAWEGLETALRVSPSEDLRGRIFTACERYVENELFETAGVERLEVLTRKETDGKGHPASSFLRLERALRAAAKAFDDLDRDEAAALALCEFAAESGNGLDLNRLHADVASMAYSMQLWREKRLAPIDEKEAVRDRAPTFNRFIDEIAAIVESANIRVTAHKRTYQDVPPSPFQSFAAKLFDLMPETARPKSHSRDALYARIAGAILARRVANGGVPSAT